MALGKKTDEELRIEQAEKQAKAARKEELERRKFGKVENAVPSAPVLTAGD